MKRFLYWFGMSICVVMVVCNVVMAYVTWGTWMASVFFAGFSCWWGLQLYRWLKEFFYLLENL